MSNLNLRRAQKAKNDEFYTLYEDIEKELEYYTTSLAGKVIYCPCDNPAYSNFYKFFKDNFHKFQLKELIATFYSPDFNPLDSFTDPLSKAPTKTIFDGTKERTYPLHSNGDFQSEDCQEILKQADIIVTNPPFSLFNEFMELLIAHNKKFLILRQ